MNLWVQIVAIVTVLLIAGGQILFKNAASAWQAAGTLFDPRVLAILSLALCVFSVATLLWVWVLQHAPLNRAYAFTALSFIIVPGLSWAFLGEPIPLNQILGIALIVGGILVIATP